MLMWKWKKFKFCCYGSFKKGESIPANAECCKFPIYECKVLGSWNEGGLSPVHVVRKLNENRYVLVSYLVDFWCLGVKDVCLKFGLSKTDLINIYKMNDGLVDVSYEEARSLILGAVDFAKAIDIDPHSDWNGIYSSFIEADRAYEKQFSFGKKGHPYYVSGPMDYENYNVKEVVNKVLKANGHYTVHVNRLG